MEQTPLPPSPLSVLSVSRITQNPKAKPKRSRRVPGPSGGLDIALIVPGLKCLVTLPQLLLLLLLRPSQGIRKNKQLQAAHNEFCMLYKK